MTQQAWSSTVNFDVQPIKIEHDIRLKEVELSPETLDSICDLLKVNEGGKRTVLCAHLRFQAGNYLCLKALIEQQGLPSEGSKQLNKLVKYLEGAKTALDRLAKRSGSLHG